MNKVIAIAAAAALVAAPVAAVAAPVFTSPATVSSNGSGEETGMFSAAPFSVLARASNVSIVPVSSAAEINYLGSQTDIDSLRSRVSNNRAVWNGLSQAGYSIDQVVGLRTSGYNEVTLFVAG